VFTLPWLQKLSIDVPEAPTVYILIWEELGFLANAIFWAVIAAFLHKSYKRFKK